MKLKKEIFLKIEEIIHASRERAIRSVDTERVLMYWHIGKVIFEEQQNEKDRAVYGKFLIKTLSEALTPGYGSGFSIRQLELCRQFFRTYPIANALHSQLNWTQYKTLIRIENKDKRTFYTEETLKNNWTSRQLERKINSQLFERLLMVTHEDIGQMQMYVHYYDRFEKQKFENNTIGILMCADKNDAMVRITLPQNNKTIIASKYQLYLPSEKQLIEEVRKEIEKLDNTTYSNGTTP